eukprot:Pompholyxophrys_punicea_v1_NODE_403_length_2052_cov_8.412412.p1 type:complete len:241 gc:universal NODE_403_length_2052_cov_8.412412:1778-1056(-)
MFRFINYFLQCRFFFERLRIFDGFFVATNENWDFSSQLGMDENQLERLFFERFEQFISHQVSNLEQADLSSSEGDVDHDDDDDNDDDGDDNDNDGDDDDDSHQKSRTCCQRNCLEQFSDLDLDEHPRKFLKLSRFEQHQILYGSFAASVPFTSAPVPPQRKEEKQAPFDCAIFKARNCAQRQHTRMMLGIGKKKWQKSFRLFRTNGFAEYHHSTVEWEWEWERKRKTCCQSTASRVCMTF